MKLAIDIGEYKYCDRGVWMGKSACLLSASPLCVLRQSIEYAIDIKNVLDIYHIKRVDLEGGLSPQWCRRSRLW